MQKSMTVRQARAWSPAIESLAPYLLWTLVIAGLSELILFRAMSRIGPHIPKQEPVLTIYNRMVDAGSFAFNVSSVAVFPVVVVVALMLLRVSARRPLLGIVGLLLLAQGGSAFMLSLTREGPSARFAFGLGSMVIMLLLAIQVLGERRREPLRALLVGLVVLSFLAAQYQVLANQGYQALGVTAAPPATRAVLEFAELVLVAAAFAAFWAWSGIRRGRSFRPSALQLGAAVPLVFIFVGSYFGRHDSSAPAILSLWTLGLTLYMPLPVYAIALVLYAAACVARLQEGSRTPAALTDAIALALLPVAGLTLELTYQHLVALAAVTLLAAGPLLATETLQAQPREQPQVV